MKRVAGRRNAIAASGKEAELEDLLKEAATAQAQTELLKGLEDEGLLEDAAPGDDEPVEAVKKERKKKPKLDENRLFDERKGLRAVPKLFKDFKPKGDTAEDVDRMFRKLDAWAGNLLSGLTIGDFLLRMKRNTIKKHEVVKYLNKMREEERDRFFGKKQREEVAEEYVDRHMVIEDDGKEKVFTEPFWDEKSEAEEDEEKQSSPEKDDKLAPVPAPAPALVAHHRTVKRTSKRRKIIIDDDEDDY